MSMIFPGMDPYLEHPAVWLGFHTRLIVYVADHLQPQLRPRYVAAVEDRVYLEGSDREVRPDVWVARDSGTKRGSGVAVLGSGVAVLEEDAPIVVLAPRQEVHESYVAILDLRSGQEVVAVIELVSPSNKYAGPGRDSYLSKQDEVLASRSHLVEIDLLRAGPHVLAVPSGVVRNRGRYDYLMSVNRARRARFEYEIYPRTLRHRLPRIRVPLAEGDPDVLLDLQAVLAQTYDFGSYDHRLDYSLPCVPPLSPEDGAWADGLIREASLRASN